MFAFRIYIGPELDTRLVALAKMEASILKTQAELDAAIANLPTALAAALQPAITTAVTAGVLPILNTLKTKSDVTPEIDFTSEIDALNNLPASVAFAVAPAVATAVTNSLSAPDAPAPADTSAPPADTSTPPATDTSTPVTTDTSTPPDTTSPDTPPA